MSSSSEDMEDIHKGVLPTRAKDKAAFLFIVIGSPFTLIWDYLVLTPAYTEQKVLNISAEIHFGFKIFILINVLGNIFMAIRAELSGNQLELPYVLKPGWRYCHECQRNYPPRSYHCRVCKKCTLRRDHHCAYTGTCISYFNIRYYIVLIFYIWVGAVYGAYYHFPYYVSTVSGQFYWYTVLNLVVPHFSFFFGVIGPYEFLVSIMQILAFAVLSFSSFLLYVQIAGLVKGQTRYERKAEINTYDLGVINNLRETLGENWFLVWLFPLIPSNIKGNGFSFLQANELEEVKNI